MGLLILNAGEIAHIDSAEVNSPISGHDMTDRESNVLPGGMGIMVNEGKIFSISDSESLQSEFVPDWDGHSTSSRIVVIDANERAIIPGLVDSHTHLIWNGDRSSELRLRQSGMSYSEISKIGGGIRSTVTSTRQMSIEEMVSTGLSKVNEASKYGTCAMEVKSGYGLDTETELMLLEAASVISRNTDVAIFPTWLGAHDFPIDRQRSQYIDDLLTDQLPKVVNQGIAKWCDVFCEDGWYNLDETEDIVKQSANFGLQSRLHVDEFVDSDGLSLAADLGSVSADHVAKSSSDARQKASDAGTMQTFLPGTPYVMGSEMNLPLIECIENRWNFSLATDYNPNCRILSLPLIANICCTRMGLDPLAALIACTHNPSTTLGDDEITGRIAVGESANMNILWSNDVDGWCQTPGENPFTHTIVSGNIV
tara:strand:+ start:12282 stop:13553 length:1272 start_codon:yes stop_codon:yes gene_type:complete